MSLFDLTLNVMQKVEKKFLVFQTTRTRIPPRDRALGTTQPLEVFWFGTQFAHAMVNLLPYGCA